MRLYYSDNFVTLYHGDCRDVLKTLPVYVAAHLVLTDPPYGQTDLTWDCIVPMSELWPMLADAAKPDAAFLFTASQPFTSAVVMSRPSWFRSEWIWKKNAGSNFATTKWHPMKEHESVLVFGRGVTTYNPIKQPRTTPIKAGYTNTSNTGKRLAYSGVTHNKGFTITDGDMRVPSSVQFWNRERGLHPNQKPVALCEYFIRTYSNAGEIVLDPFMGSGSTLVAAKACGRKAIGIEQKEEYCEVAATRLRSEGELFSAVG